MSYYSNGNTSLTLLANAAAGQGTAKNLTYQGRGRKSRRSVGNGNTSSNNPTHWNNNTRNNRKGRKSRKNRKASRN
jgi:hypothetical protein